MMRFVQCKVCPDNDPDNSMSHGMNHNLFTAPAKSRVVPLPFNLPNLMSHGVNPHVGQ